MWDNYTPKHDPSRPRPRLIEFLTITKEDRLRGAIRAAIEQIEAGQPAKALEYLKEASGL